MGRTSTLAVAAALCAFPLTTAQLLKPTKISTFKMNEAAVVSIVPLDATRPNTDTWFPGNKTGLLMTTFGFATGDGVFAFPDAAKFVDGGAPATPAQVEIDSTIHWPNQAELAPTNAIAGHRVVLEAGGFFPNPLKATGQIVLTDVTSAQPTSVQISTDKSNFFYHRAVWSDMNGDGKLDVVAARASVPTLPWQSKVGELIWLEQPATDPMTTKWTEHVLVSPHGPDVSFQIVTLDSTRPPVVIAGQFFTAQQLAMFVCPGKTWSDCSAAAGNVQSVVIDKTIGPLFNLEMADVNADGKRDLLVTTNKADGTGGVYVFELPANPLTDAWVRHDLSVGFRPIHYHLPGAGGPGTARTFHADTRDMTHKPSILVSGDDNGTVSVLVPAGESPTDWRYNISVFATGSSTVGTPAVGDLNGDHYVEIVVPMYSDNRVDVWTLAPKATSTAETPEAGPCCAGACTAPLIKYYSVDHGFGHAPFCGETCLDPSKFKIYHLFEKNLTAATGGPPNTTHPCSLQLTATDTHYSVYNSTVTHGVPGVLSVTLDLYAPGKTANTALLAPSRTSR